VAVNLSDDDLDDFCTASGARGNNTVTEMIKMVTRAPGYRPAPRDFQVFPNFAEPATHILTLKPVFI
jgi:hypothetical protein